MTVQPAQLAHPVVPAQQLPQLVDKPITAPLELLLPVFLVLQVLSVAT